MKYTAVFVLLALVASAYSATLPEAAPQLAPEAIQEVEPKDAAAPAEQARDKRGLVYSPWVSPYAAAYSYYPYSYSAYSTYHPVAYSAWSGYRPYYPAYYSPYIVG